MARDRLYRDNCPNCAVEDNSQPNRDAVRATNAARGITLMQVGMHLNEVMFGAQVELASIERDLDDPEFADPESRGRLVAAHVEKRGELFGLTKASEVLDLMHDPHNKTRHVDRSRVLERVTLVPHQTIEDALAKTGRSSIASGILFRRASAAYMAAFNARGAEGF